MRFNIYVGRTLYVSTLNIDEAFRVFRLHIRQGNNVKLKFIPPAGHQQAA